MLQNCDSDTSVAHICRSYRPIRFDIRRCVRADHTGINDRDHRAIRLAAPHAAAVVENRYFAISARTNSNRYQAGQADIQVEASAHRQAELGAARFDDTKRRKFDPRVCFAVERTNRFILHKPAGRVVAVETKTDLSKFVRDVVDSRCVVQFVETRLKYNDGRGGVKPKNQHDNSDNTHLKEDQKTLSTVLFNADFFHDSVDHCACHIPFLWYVISHIVDERSSNFKKCLRCQVAFLTPSLWTAVTAQVTPYCPGTTNNQPANVTGNCLNDCMYKCGEVSFPHMLRFFFFQKKK